MFYLSPWSDALLFTIIGIYWGFDRTHKRKDRDAVDKEGEISDYNVLKDELNWTANEAEVANLRSEILLRRMLHLEEDLGKIKESIKMSLDVFMEMDRKLGIIEGDFKLREKRTQIGSRKKHETDIVTLTNGFSGARLTDLDKQVIDLLSTNGPMSSRDLQVKIGKSREHISRLLGKLVDQKFIGRNRLGRKFTYNVLNVNDK